MMAFLYCFISTLIFGGECHDSKIRVRSRNSHSIRQEEALFRRDLQRNFDDNNGGSSPAQNSILAVFEERIVTGSTPIKKLQNITASILQDMEGVQANLNDTNSEINQNEEAISEAISQVLSIESNFASLTTTIRDLRSQLSEYTGANDDNNIKADRGGDAYEVDPVIQAEMASVEAAINFAATSLKDQLTTLQLLYGNQSEGLASVHTLSTIVKDAIEAQMPRIESQIAALWSDITMQEIEEDANSIVAGHMTISALQSDALLLQSKSSEISSHVTKLDRHLANLYSFIIRLEQRVATNEALFNQSSTVYQYHNETRSIRTQLKVIQMQLSEKSTLINVNARRMKKIMNRAIQSESILGTHEEQLVILQVEVNAFDDDQDDERNRVLSQIDEVAEAASAIGRDLQNDLEALDLLHHSQSAELVSWESRLKSITDIALEHAASIHAEIGRLRTQMLIIEDINNLVSHHETIMQLNLDTSILLSETLDLRSILSFLSTTVDECGLTMKKLGKKLEDVQYTVSANKRRCGEFVSIATETGSIQLSDVSQCDECIHEITLPFEFHWLGGLSMVTKIWVTSNGSIKITNNDPYRALCCGPFPIRSFDAGPEDVPRISAIQANLDTRYETSKVYYQVTNYDSVIISWENMRFRGRSGYISAQAELFENGKVEIRWGSGYAPGIAAGLEDSRYSMYFPATGYPFNAVGIANHFPERQCRSFVF